MSFDGVCGFPEEWSDFASRHPAFIATKPGLEALFDKVLHRPRLQEDADRAVFCLGLMAVQDFNELLLLAANGYGTGAQKILRVLYEHTVTARYIYVFPQEAERFLSFDHYLRLNYFDRAAEFSRDPLFSEVKRAALQSEWDKVKSLYREKKPSRWSTHNLLSMANETGQQLSELFSPCVDETNIEIHASSAAILSRVEATANGRLAFTADSQARTADKAFKLALILIGFVLDTLNSRFNLSLDKEIEQYFQSI